MRAHVLEDCAVARGEAWRRLSKQPQLPLCGPYAWSVLLPQCLSACICSSHRCCSCNCSAVVSLVRAFPLMCLLEPASSRHSSCWPVDAAAGTLLAHALPIAQALPLATCADRATCVVLATAPAHASALTSLFVHVCPCVLCAWPSVRRSRAHRRSWPRRRCRTPWPSCAPRCCKAPRWATCRTSSRYARARRGAQPTSHCAPAGLRKVPATHTCP